MIEYYCAGLYQIHLVINIGKFIPQEKFKVLFQQKLSKYLFAHSNIYVNVKVT